MIHNRLVINLFAVLQQSNGQYGDAHVDRLELLAGSLRKSMDTVFHENIGQTYLKNHQQTMPKEVQLSTQVKDFIDE